MDDKIMAGGNLNNIVLRLSCCLSLLRVVHEAIGERGGNAEACDALAATSDLLECILRDFDADIDSAKDYEGSRANEKRS